MSRAVRAVELLARKRDGAELDADELGALIGGYLRGTVGEGQMAAFLMAGVLRGFSDREAIALTRILLDSGDRLDLSGLPGPTFDKHSTGGVADSTSLLVVPLLAAAGGRVLKLSGRGLGFTGGTLDKLEAIPGMRVAWPPEDLLRIAREAGAVIAAQTDRLVPADRALYALRDVTATVDSPALIASSVMAKKLAGGAATVVLDVKTGRGAFMASLQEARDLAALCVRIATAAGRRTAAVVSRMDQPLGRAVGNALEVAECVRLLASPPAGRMAELALSLAATALGLADAGDGGEVDAAGHRDRLVALWRDGSALQALERMVAAQGGDPRVCSRAEAVLPAAPVTATVTASAGGYVGAVDARAVGEISVGLGAGRARKDDAVDPSVGLVLAVEVGDAVQPGQPLAVVHARTEDDAVAASRLLRQAVDITQDVPEPAATEVDWHMGRWGEPAGLDALAG